jgi:ribose transport system substrate-binding protein
MKRSIGSVVGVVALALAVGACGSDSGSSSSSDKSSGGGDATKPVKIAVSIYGTGAGTWSDGYGKRLETLAPKLKKDGVDLIVNWADGTAQGQAAQISSLLAQKPDAVGIYPLNSQATVPSFVKIDRAGAKAVQVVIPPVDEAKKFIKAYVGGADEVATAASVAKAFSEEIASEGEVAIIRGPAGGSDNVLRAKGFMEGLKGTKLKVVADVNTDWGDQTKIYNGVTAVLKNHPNVIGLFTQYDGISVAARKAVNDANLDHEVHIANVVGGSCPGKKLLEKGEISMVAWHDPWTAADETARLMPKIARGEDVAFDSFMKDPIVTSKNVGDRPCHY